MKKDLEHPPINFGKTGVLIINLGTPDSTSWLDIRKYLKEFLSDRRVIEVNPFIWQIILNLFILTFRPSKTAHAYRKIWRKESNESPLLFFTTDLISAKNDTLISATRSLTLKLMFFTAVSRNPIKSASIDKPFCSLS